MSKNASHASHASSLRAGSGEPQAGHITGFTVTFGAKTKASEAVSVVV